MKVLRWINFLLIIVLLSACGASPSGTGTPSAPIIKIPFAQDTPTPLPTTVARITPAPDVKAAVNNYLQALQNDSYDGMYGMLTQTSRDAISLEDFSKRYSDALNVMSAASVEYSINSSQVSPFRAEAAYSVTYHTILAGDIQRSIVMRLENEGGAWKVVWDDGLILPELVGGNILAMEYSVPARGNIYDRDGKPIVSQADAYAFGIQTEQIDYKIVNTLVGELGKLCGYDPEYIRNRIDQVGPGSYLPMCEGTSDEAARLLAINPGGLVISKYGSRYYFETGLAPQAVGYTLSIPPEEFNDYRRLGYDGSEKVGRAGIEKWAEQYLAGKHGGILRVVAPSGTIVATLGQSAPQAADSVYLTVDENMQYYAQQAIEYFRGAVVVMEVDTGRVVAMASSPDFDPNLFEPTNPNNGGLTDLLNNANQPLLNRAAQGQYPLGSAFKTITMAAALESGLYLKDTPYDCQYEFTELPDRTLYDWTYEHCQQAIAAGEFCDNSSTKPSGLLTLQGGLMRSCNPYFWHIGLDLYNYDRKDDIAKMARAFGLGSVTGIEQIPEAAGQIIDPVTAIDAVNQAIGQGDMQVTPLQVATFMAAIANGGTLYRPQIVEKIQPVDGSPKLTFKPEARGTLPLRAENLNIIREALLMVTHETKGTAHYNLRGLQFEVAGKTGTAESGNGKSHAWFVGYTLNKTNTQLPDLAIAVIVENIGEGSEYAVPIFRAMVETYYYGSPQWVTPFGKIGEPPYTPTP
ncbi:MAG: penicillin-binding transpeptidase domain-containing protein [Anaerolineales bacterium]|nr:penicillin-binding transpeptidase domain-containing protein [Anaerolineales bacterium]